MTLRPPTAWLICALVAVALARSAGARALFGCCLAAAVLVSEHLMPPPYVFEQRRGAGLHARG